MRIAIISLSHLVMLICLLWLPPLFAVDYTVQSGDTLTAIARRHLPQPKKNDQRAIDEYVKQVVRDNPELFPDENPDRLRPGMKMNIPSYREPTELPIKQPELPPVGTLIELSGQGWLIQRDETRNPLLRGITLRQGDSIQTLEQSRARIEFIDGSSITLKSSSQFSIDEFRWDSQNQTGRSILSFLKGAFRAISGLIGQSNPDDYAVQTMVGSIGIRGTDFGARLCQQETCIVHVEDQPISLSEGIYVGVLQGSIALKSDERETLVNSGEAIYQKDAGAEPEPIDNLPGLIFDAAELQTYVSEVITTPPQIEAAPPPPPFYDAFLLDRQGRVVRDGQGNCIRSRNYRDDHHVAQCE